MDKNIISNNKNNINQKKNKEEVSKPSKKEKEILVDTNSSTKKKRRPEESMEEILKDPDNKLSQKISKLGVDSDSEYISEGSDEDVVEDRSLNSDDYVEEDEEEFDKKQKKGVKKVNIWDEKANKLGKDEFLDFDNEAYEMLHRAKPEWPCMSIDFIMPERFFPPVKSFFCNTKDLKPVYKDDFPYTCYMVAGSQTTGYDGYLYFMKWYNMQKTKYDDDPDISLDNSHKSDQGSEKEDPFMKFEKMKVSGNINRVKAMKNSYLSAYWTDKGTVELIDLRSLINKIETQQQEDIENSELFKPSNKKKKLNPKNISVNSFKRKLDGFGLDWSVHDDFLLAAGGNDKILEIYAPKDEMCSEFVVRNTIVKAHDDAIEDIAWSPFDRGVLATCSIDRSIRIWDEKVKGAAITIPKAHASDVNVISFNPHNIGKKDVKVKNVLLASGGDDGAVKVWDIRRPNNPLIDNIEWHKGPITSLSWDPYDDSQLAVSSEDNSLSIWDFSVEPDDQYLFDNKNKQIPQQLVFLHQGQENIKDLKFHPLYKNFIVSTAQNGINVFKLNFEEDDEEEEDDDDNNDDGRMELEK